MDEENSKPCEAIHFQNFSWIFRFKEHHQIQKNLELVKLWIKIFVLFIVHCNHDDMCLVSRFMNFHVVHSHFDTIDRLFDIKEQLKEKLIIWWLTGSPCCYRQFIADIFFIFWFEVLLFLWILAYTQLKTTSKSIRKRDSSMQIPQWLRNSIHRSIHFEPSITYCCL